MSVEEFRNGGPEYRNEDFYLGSFNCAKWNLYHAIDYITSAIEYFIDIEDPDFKEFDDCFLGLTASLNRIWDRMSRTESIEDEHEVSE